MEKYTFRFIDPENALAFIGDSIDTDVLPGVGEKIIVCDRQWQVAGLTCVSQGLENERQEIHVRLSPLSCYPRSKLYR